MNDPEHDAAAPLHERLEALLVRDSTGREITPVFVPAATLREAAAALRPPEGDAAWVIELLDVAQRVTLESADGDQYHAVVTHAVGAALAHLRRLAAVEAERDRLRSTLAALAQASIRSEQAQGVTPQDASDLPIMRRVARALEPTPAAEGADDQ